MPFSTFCIATNRTVDHGFVSTLSVCVMRCFVILKIFDKVPVCNWIKFPDSWQVYPGKLFALWLVFGKVMTGVGSISWLAVKGVESNVEFILVSAGLDMPLYI